MKRRKQAAEQIIGLLRNQESSLKVKVASLRLQARRREQHFQAKYLGTTGSGAKQLRQVQEENPF